MLLTCLRLSDLLTGQTVHQVVIYKQSHVTIDITVSFIHCTFPRLHVAPVCVWVKLILPLWHCVWRPRWGRPGTWPGIQWGPQMRGRFLEHHTHTQHKHSNIHVLATCELVCVWVMPCSDKLDQCRVCHQP